MVYELYEKTTENDDVKEWAFYVVFTGSEPSPNERPFASGHCFLGIDDAEGCRRYEDGRQDTQFEVERLNRNAQPPSRHR